MKCFVAAAALLGLGSAEPFLSTYSPYVTSYASAIAPSVHAAPAIHAVPAYHAAPAPVRSIPVTYSSNVVAPVHAPVSAYVSEPIVRTAPVTTIKSVPTGVTQSQYHSQDEFGNYAYGYANPNSEKHESGNAHTGVKGHYSYVDGTGLNRRVDYVADGFGFRASGHGVTGASLLRKRRSLGYGLNTFATPSLVSYPAVPYAHSRLSAYAAAPQPISHPVQVAQLKSVPSAPASQQYHTQDEYGNYAYGYANQNSEKQESGNAYTGVQGHYSYVDAYGLNRRVDYVADAAGFRASGHGILRKKRSLAYGLSPYAAVPSYSHYPFTTSAYAAPAAVTRIAAQPLVKAAPVAPATSSHQYHSQDEFGNYSYGYANQNSEKQEAGNVHTGVRGHYSYIDGFGLNRRVDYVADGLGFRHV